MIRPRTSVRSGRLATLAGLVVLAACSSGGPGASPEGSAAPNDAWAGLAVPRPDPLDGAPRIAIAEIGVAGSTLGLPEGDATAAVTELVVAGLLERTDVRFVERRRFVPAADLARRGATPPAGQPPVGSSESPEWLLTGTVLMVPGGSGGRLALVLTEVESGGQRATWTVDLDGARADAVGLARSVVALALEGLRAEGLAPSGAPLPAFAVDGPPIPPSAVSAFLSGVRAGDRWDWEAARAGYQRAIREGAGGFAEAGVALRRAARLRAGGSLGVS